jgi:hypothetical protein
MRTTLDIADDVLLAAKELARRERKSAGQVISELARRALLGPEAAATAASAAEGPEEFFGFRPLPSRGVVVTNELIDRLREEDVD